MEMSNSDPNDPGVKKKHNRYCVEKMYGVTVAVDCLTRYVQRVPDDACALNMLGILFERERHFRSAKLMLARALKLQLDPNLADKVLQNLGRVLCKLGEFEAAIKCYNKISSATSDFYSKVGLALASWKAEKYQDSYNAYGEALKKAQDDEQRSHVLAAMATIAYKFQVSGAIINS
jgi:superkiller protein 3